MDWLIEQWTYLREHEEWFYWIGAISIATFLVSAVVVPFLLRRMPHDYFLEDSAGSGWMKRQHPVLRWVLLILKNLFGLVLVVGGLIMFLTPGQGILTLVMGLLLLNFPGKRRFEIWLMQRKPIQRAVDWIRRRGGRKSLEFPEG